MANILLYYYPNTKASRPRWALEELGLGYDLKKIDLQAGEHKTEAFKKIHPLGLVPAMDYNGTTFFESTAMCQFLADQYPEKKLAPAMNNPKRAHYYQWMNFALQHLEPEIVKFFMHTMRLPAEQQMKAEADAAVTKLTAYTECLENHLKQNEFLLGSDFSMADIVVGSGMIWAQSMNLLTNCSAIKSYTERLKNRAAYVKAKID